MTDETKKIRTRQRRRTGVLVKAVAMGVSEYGVGAARVVVVEFAGFSSVPEMAAAMAVHRSALWQMLGYYKLERKDDLRLKCDRFLGLSPGAMHEVLEPIENLKMEEEDDGD